MTFNELKHIVSNGEGLYVEFKHKINFPDKIAREIVAFTNTKGGTLLIGVDDNRTIYGLKNADEEIFALQDLVKKYIRFPVSYTIEKISVHPKKVVVVAEIKEAGKKPNYALEKPGLQFGTAYVRVADKSIKASPEMVKILQARAAAHEQRLVFGKNEKKILELIDGQQYITVKQVQDSLLLSYATASDTLISLTLASITDIVPEENKDDKFVIKI